MITDSKIVEYLHNNPDFFQRNPEALEAVEVNHGPEGAISLVERQLNLFREQNHQLRNKNDMLHGHMHELIENAHRNDELLEKCLQFHKKLADAKNLVELLQVCEVELCKIFELDGVAFKSFENGPGSLRFVTQTDRRGFLDMMNYHFPDNKPLCGQITLAELKVLFNDPESPIRSAGFMPIGFRAKYGVLVIGSHDKEHFAPGMGTFFLEFLADIISVFYRHLAH